MIFHRMYTSSLNNVFVSNLGPAAYEGMRSSDLMWNLGYRGILMDKQRGEIFTSAFEWLLSRHD